MSLVVLKSPSNVEEIDGKGWQVRPTDEKFCKKNSEKKLGNFRFFLFIIFQY